MRQISRKDFGHCENGKENSVASYNERPLPGTENGMDWSKTPVNRETVIAGMKMDGGIPLPENGQVPAGYHKVYFVLTGETNDSRQFEDIHFYRQGPDGKWSSVLNNPESGPEVLITDASGKPITDPSKANSNWKNTKATWPTSYGSAPVKAHNYSVQGGYFLLPDKWQGPPPHRNPLLDEKINQ